jgi:hypothetical protein
VNTLFTVNASDGLMSATPKIESVRINPFSRVAVTDSAGLSIQGFTIILYDSSSNYLNPTDANGTLAGAGLTQAGVGTYTLAPGTPAQVSSELDALTFTPAVGGTTVTTDFLLSAFDGATTSDNSDTSVIASPAPAVPAAFTAADHLGPAALTPADVTPGSAGGAGAPPASGKDWTTFFPVPGAHW